MVAYVGAAPRLSDIAPGGALQGARVASLDFAAGNSDPAALAGIRDARRVVGVAAKLAENYANVW